MNTHIFLSNKNIASTRILRVCSIPHLRLLGDGTLTMNNNKTVMEEYKNEMANLLFQIYQYYMDLINNGRKSLLMSIELLWITYPVERQPYKASVDIYIVIRSIGEQIKEIQQILDNMIEFCQSSLQLQWYDLDKCDLNIAVQAFNSVKKEKVRAVLKEERIDPLPIRDMPECYGFDIIPHTGNDLHQLTNVLINYPDSCLSFQLIPTSYTSDEQRLLMSYSQILSSFAEGFQDQSIGKTSILSAEKLARLYTYYANQRNRPLFKFNIVAWGTEEAVSAISSRIVGLLNSSLQSERVNTTFADLSTENIYQTEDYFHTLPWVIHNTLVQHESRFRLTKKGLQSFSANHNLLPFIITADESTEFFSIPIANTKIAAGFNVNDSGKKSRTYADGIINAGDITLGTLKSSSSDTIGLNLKDLAKHMLIVGTPGSGKTTFSVGLLDRLWKEHHIPFLVIEPAKNEYRALIQSIPDLQVFTPGKNFISPFVFNPFVPPKNVKLETYKSTLKTAFAAGVSMSTPLDKIFEESINNCYSDFGWLDSYTNADKGKTFNISDFIKCFQETFDAIGYSGDARNIGRAGIVRLKSLVNLFDSYFSIPIEDILTKPTIIELAAIENSDQKALIIALILLSTLAYVNANYIGEGGLKNFILLEEAHVLLDSSSNVGEGSANPAAIAQGLVKRMLAEIRSYGVGLGIADQSPRKVGIDIVALTDIKVAFRLVESQDKQILADSTSMNDIQVARLAKMKPGEAFLFFNKLEEPEEIITPDYRLANNISISLSDEGIKKLSTYWNERQDKLRPYPECILTPYCHKFCTFERKLLSKEIARRIFNKHIQTGAKDMEKVRYVFSKILSLIMNELNDEVLDRQLLSCIKVHLWRKIKYETSLKIAELTIEKSLIKE